MGLISRVAVGTRFRANKWNAIADQVNELTQPGWTSFGSATTLFAGSVTAPNLGSSTIRATYRRPDGSDFVMVRVQVIITTGGSFSAGSGNWRLNLPVAAASGALAGVVGRFWINDAGTAFRTGVLILDDTTHCVGFINGGTGGPYITSSGPGTAWATNDDVRMSFIYEAA